MACSSACSLDLKGTSSGLNDHNLTLPSFLGNTWDFSNSEKPLLSVDSGEESRDLIQHKLVWTKSKEHISENLDVPENPRAGRSVITISSYEHSLANYL